MAYDSYKLTRASSDPTRKMLEEKKLQVEYFYQFAFDREDNCTINGRAFVESPRVFNRKDKSKSTHVITVETIHEEDRFNYGDYLFFDNSTWLCMSSFVFHNLYCKGEFTLCNWSLKWQDETGAILSYPCVTSSSSIGEDSDKVLTLPSNQKYILLPFNEQTSKLKADKRFFVDRKSPPTPYKIIGDTDTTSYNYGGKGLIQMLVEQDRLLEVDDIELGICNYVKPGTTLPPEENTYSTISINGSLNIGGTKRTLTPTFYNSDSSINAEIIPVWNIVLPVGYENYFTVSYMDEKCTIQVKENYDLIGLNVIAQVSDTNGEYLGELVIEIGSGW